MEPCESVPDIYFDGVRVTVTLFGVNMTLSLRQPHPPEEGHSPESHDLVVVRTSVHHAKVLAMLLRKQIRRYEEETGAAIVLPGELYEALGLDAADW